MAGSKLVFFLIMELSVCIFALMLILGISITERAGTPTISRMLADSDAVTIIYVAGVVLYGELRAEVTMAHAFADLSQNGEMIWITRVANICGLFQIVCFVLVGIVSLDYNFTGHIIVAGLAGLFSVLRESLLCYRRFQCLPAIAYETVLWCNALMILFLVLVMIAFVVCAWTLVGQYSALFLPYMEFIVFWLIVLLPVFQFYDFYEPCEKEE